MIDSVDEVIHHHVVEAGGDRRLRDAVTKRRQPTIRLAHSWPPRPARSTAGDLIARTGPHPVGTRRRGPPIPGMRARGRSYQNRARTARQPIRTTTRPSPLTLLKRVVRYSRRGRESNGSSFASN